MPDNFSFTEGNGKTGAADNIGGVLYARVKIAQGAPGSATDVSSAAPLHVTLANTGANSTAVKTDGSAVTQPVSVASLPLPSGAATSANQTTGNTSLSNLDTNAGSTADAAAAAGGTGTISAKLRRITQGLEDLKTSIVIAAGTALLGRVSVSLETSTIYNGTTALTPKYAAIAASSSGNNTVLAAVASKKIRVLAVQLIANAAVNAKWQSGAGGTDLTGLAYCAANGGYVLPFNPVGWFETASNTLLNLNLSGAVAVGGSITYVEV
jgi:hypothetical protein